MDVEKRKDEPDLNPRDSWWTKKTCLLLMMNFTEFLVMKTKRYHIHEHSHTHTYTHDILSSW